MKIGFTGTRKGMTEAQRNALLQYLNMYRLDEFHHGDCIGADSEAVMLVKDCAAICLVISHPPTDEQHRAFNPYRHVARPKKPYLARNRDIVDETDMLIATPAEAEHQDRGGTWYTIDYAEKQGKPLVVICPDGAVRGTAKEKQ